MKIETDEEIKQLNAAVPSIVKRLLMASREGVTFDYANGHRLIRLHETWADEPCLLVRLTESGKLDSFRGKCYGSIHRALDHIDFLYREMGSTATLESSFDYYQDWGFDKSCGLDASNWDKHV